jgi:hypothetical protein
MKIHAILAGSLLLVCTTAVAATEPAPATTVESVTVNGAAPVPADPVICRRAADTGSRIYAPKVCRKKSEWAAISKPRKRIAVEVKVEGCPTCEIDQNPLPPTN